LVKEVELKLHNCKIYSSLVTASFFRVNEINVLKETGFQGCLCHFRMIGRGWRHF